MKINKDLQMQLYRTMILIRQFEEEAIKQRASLSMPGPMHSYIGEEAISTGVCATLRPDDYITSTHRGHGHCIGKGGKVSLMMAELFGKKAGYCKGKGGSMHIADTALGILGANGIVAAGTAIAGGAALSIKMRGTDQVAVSFFGDGASNAGTFHESLNMASIWKLPVIFVCENNQYAISMSQTRSTSIKDIYLRKDSYNMEGCKVNGNDVLAVFKAAKEAVGRARDGLGPTLIECKTYRLRGHYEGEGQRTYSYRKKKEIEAWKEKCPIKQFRKKLLSKKLVSEDEIVSVEKAVAHEIMDAVEFAMDCQLPDPEDALNELYGE